MNDASVWERLSSAPYDRDLEVAVIEGSRVHPLVFACRRTPGGWINVATQQRVTVSPTHWRVWAAGLDRRFVSGLELIRKSGHRFSEDHAQSRI
jgi:hypothetical protein